MTVDEVLTLVDAAYIAGKRTGEVAEDGKQYAPSYDDQPEEVRYSLRNWWRRGYEAGLREKLECENG